MIKKAFKNSVCPITLEELKDKDPRHIFVHCDIGIMMTELYIYLTKSLYFTNPVTRVPFDIKDLLALETAMKSVHGIDIIECIAPSLPDLEGIQRRWNTEEDLEVFSEEELLSRISSKILSTTEDALVVEVDLDIDDDHPTTDGEYDEPLQPAALVRLSPEMEVLPYPSLVRLFMDTGRQRRMKDQLNLLQFLEYDAAEVFRHFCHVVNETSWQRWVWEQTSTTVLELVTSRMGKDDCVGIQDIIHENDSEHVDLQLEVHYTTKWDIYRVILLTMWERKYLQICGDITTISPSEFIVINKMHRTNINEQDASYINPFLDSIQEKLIVTPKSAGQNP